MTTRQLVARRTAVRLTVAMLTANVAGALVIFVFAVTLLPLPDELRDQERTANAVAFAAYLAISVTVGQLWGRRIAARSNDWLRGDRPADDAVRASLLRLPLRQSVVNATMWVGAAVVFGVLNAFYAPSTVIDISSTVLLAGFVTCGLSYLLCERLLRPAVTLAMEGSQAAPVQVLGVRPRLVLAWALGSGIPLAGILLGVTVPGDRHPPLGPGAVTFLAVVGLGVGLFAILTAAGAVADPIRSVAQGLRAVGEGDREVTVPVYDATEIGQLQSGFNAMVVGLRERDRLRDLFGRQVGDAVAAQALHRGVELGGEEREVAVLFVDVVGSTALPEQLAPEEVVGRLNEFFSVVVEVVTAAGGWVNKFEGDAALAVFGAPTALPDAAGCALTAARLLARRLEPLPLRAGIGVGAGPVVAGNVGATSRFEYTVIGDPVNAAARLSELAKADPGGVLADAAVLAGAGEDERRHWATEAEVTLRGRSRPTRVARPVSRPAAGPPRTPASPPA